MVCRLKIIANRPRARVMLPLSAARKTAIPGAALLSTIFKYAAALPFRVLFQHPLRPYWYRFALRKHVTAGVKPYEVSFSHTIVRSRAGTLFALSGS